MGWTESFYTSTGADGQGKFVYHNQTDCEYGKKIIADGNRTFGQPAGYKLCERCSGLAGK
jgi:hypothetical protein